MPISKDGMEEVSFVEAFRKVLSSARISLLSPRLQTSFSGKHAQINPWCFPTLYSDSHLHVHPSIPAIQFGYFNSWLLKIFIYLFLEKGREGEREGERHQCVVAFRTSRTGDLVRDPGICSRLGIEPATLWFSARTQSTELHQPGPKLFFKILIIYEVIMFGYVGLNINSTFF